MLPAEATARRAERVRLAFRLITWALWFGIVTGYLELTTEQRKRAGAQFIGFNQEDLLTMEHYEDFLERRARTMASALNEFLNLG